MHENQKVNSINSLSPPQRILSFVLGVGVLLATSHGAALLGDHHDGLTPTDFSGKVVKDLHIHNDFSPQFAKILVDPRSLRHIRSEGDKTGENDLYRSGWDVYQV